MTCKLSHVSLLLIVAALGAVHPCVPAAFASPSHAAPNVSTRIKTHQKVFHDRLLVDL